MITAIIESEFFSEVAVGLQNINFQLHTDLLLLKCHYNRPKEKKSCAKARNN